MVISQISALRHAQFGEHVAGSDLSPQLTLGIGARPVGSDLRPVGEFVQSDGIVFLALLEMRLRRQLDVIAVAVWDRPAIERLVAAEPDVGPGCHDGVFGRLVIDELRPGCQFTHSELVEVLAFDLIDVENGVGLEQAELDLLFLAGLLIGLDLPNRLEENDSCPTDPEARFPAVA